MADESAVQVESKAATLVEPDLGFVRELKEAGGDTLKKCFQCATCSVVCALSPDEKPYPRKEMIYSQWGLKDRLLNSVDVWLCHFCNDCSTHCPRGARPGDTLRAVRALSFKHYAFPSFMGKIVGEAKYLPIMLAIPVLVLLLGIKIAGGHIPSGTVEYRDLFPLLLIDVIFVGFTLLALTSLALGVWNFLQGIHANGVREGYAEDKPLSVIDYLKSLVSVIPTILFHQKFKLCITNKDRRWAHLLVFFGFIGLFIVTNIGFFGIYVGPFLRLSTGFTDFLAPPYSLANPVKLFGLVSGLGLLVGILWVIANRLKPKDAESTITYLDWSLIIAVLATVSTGLLTWISRTANAGSVAYVIYFLHLTAVFYIIAYLPYSKLAHLVYRTVAMGYAAHVGREFGVEVVAPAPAATSPEPAAAEESAAEEPAAEDKPEAQVEAEATADAGAEAAPEAEEKKGEQEEEEKKE